MSRGQNELVCKFKMATGDMVSIRGQVMEYTYIPTGIKRELVRVIRTSVLSFPRGLSD